MEENTAAEPQAAAPAAPRLDTDTAGAPSHSLRPRNLVALPRYRSHKVVEAARIIDSRQFPEGLTLLLDLGEQEGGNVGAREQVVTESWPGCFRPAIAGGYYVRYEDGHESWSPAEAFETGYTRVPEAAAATPPAPPPESQRYPCRLVETHRVNPANEQLVIAVLDDAGSGGANHLYDISGFSSRHNPSDPFVARYGRPAEHTTLLFQNGPIGEVGVNGITHEVLLAILIDRMRAFQAGPYACDENRCALAHLEQATRFLHARTMRRTQAGTEGTHKGT